MEIERRQRFMREIPDPDVGFRAAYVDRDARAVMLTGLAYPLAGGVKGNTQGIARLAAPVASDQIRRCLIFEQSIHTRQMAERGVVPWNPVIHRDVLTDVFEETFSGR